MVSFMSEPSREYVLLEDFPLPKKRQSRQDSSQRSSCHQVQRNHLRRCTSRSSDVVFGTRLARYHLQSQRAREPTVAACLAHAVLSTYVMIACAIIHLNTRTSSSIPLRTSWGERHASEASTGRSTSEHFVRREPRAQDTQNRHQPKSVS